MHKYCKKDYLRNSHYFQEQILNLVDLIRNDAEFNRLWEINFDSLTNIYEHANKKLLRVANNLCEAEKYFDNEANMEDLETLDERINIILLLLRADIGERKIRRFNDRVEMLRKYVCAARRECKFSFITQDEFNFQDRLINIRSDIDDFMSMKEIIEKKLNELMEKGKDLDENIIEYGRVSRLYERACRLASKIDEVLKIQTEYEELIKIENEYMRSKNHGIIR